MKSPCVVSHILGSTATRWLVLSSCVCASISAGAIAPPLMAAQATKSQSALTQDTRDVARDHMSRSDYDKAIICYVSLLGEKPVDALSIKADLGICYKAKRDYAKAIPLFLEVAAAKEKRRAEAMLLIADCLSEQGKLAEAITALTKAYNECPDARAEALLRRAARQCDFQQYEGVLADYQEFIAAYPDQKDRIKPITDRLPEIKLRAAGIYYGPAAALEAEWTSAKVNNADGAYTKLVGDRLGESCYKEQLWSKGAEVYARLVQDYPADESRFKMSLGLCQKGQKQYDAAIETFAQLAKKNSSCALEALFRIEDCLSEQEKFADCVAHLTKMSTEYPDFRAQILMRRAARLGDLNKCEECLADLLEVKEEYPEKLAEATLGEGLTRVALWQQSGDTTELQKGMQILESYKTKFPNEASFVAASQFHLGMYHLYPVGTTQDNELQASAEKGRTILRAAIKDCPETFYTWWMKTEHAASYSREGRYTDAVAELGNLLNQNPPDSWKEYILYILGDAQVRMGKTEEGTATLSKLVTLFPGREWAEAAARRLAATEVGR